MKITPLKIGERTARYPLIQGGMGVGVSLSSLAGHVAREGGVGIISTAQIGYREPDYDGNPVEANLRAIASEVAKARQIGGEEGIIGVNIMVATRFYERYVRAACQAGVDLIISGAGLPVSLPEYAKGYDVCLAPIVSSAKAAAVICKMWDRKYKRVPDLLVIEGPMAGGHLGFSVDELQTYAGKSYDGEITAIERVVREYGDKYQKKIPVIIAGGVFDSSDVEHCLGGLGADGVQVATRFVTTVECDASDAYKQTYLDAKKEDIVIVKSPVGMPGRAIKNRFMERCMAGDPPPLGRCHLCIEKCDRTKIPYCISDALLNAVKGNVDQALLFCGANAYRCRVIETVRDVIHSLFPWEKRESAGL